MTKKVNPRIGVSTFANRYTPNAQTKVCKRASTSPTQEKLFFKISTPSKIFKTANAQPTHKDQITNLTMTAKLNNNNGLQTRWTRTPAGNSGFASCGVKCLNSSSVFQFNFSAGLTVLCPEIPHERKAAER
jgi:hypothetical protein